MPKCRQALADALARLVFDKPLAELNRAERAELNFMRTLNLDNDQQRQSERTQSERQDQSRAATLH